jgi:protein-S-isoprenylcysteine O-methyltransferase Ste14
MNAPIPHPGVSVPPPFLFVAAFLVGVALHRWAMPLSILPTGVGRGVLVLGGWAAIAAGLLLAMWGRVTFLKARTSVMPTRPASSLVRHGPYRFSRNPMYVGLTILYVGLSVRTNMAWPLLALLPALVVLRAFVVRREERYLTSAFGPEYQTYCRQVRRWL